VSSLLHIRLIAIFCVGLRSPFIRLRFFGFDMLSYQILGLWSGSRQKDRWDRGKFPFANYCLEKKTRKRPTTLLRDLIDPPFEKSQYFTTERWVLKSGRAVEDILTADVKEHPNHLLSEFLILDIDNLTWKGEFSDDKVTEIKGMLGKRDARKTRRRRCCCQGC